MKAGRIVGGILLTASIVSVGSALSGWHKKLNEDKKLQIELKKQLKQSGISDVEYSRIEAQAQTKNTRFQLIKYTKKLWIR